LINLGFNFEVVKEKDDFIGFWDVGGKDTIRSLWPSFYKNINVHGIIFMIDAKDEERLPEARMELHKLMNEEELRNAVLLVIFNLKESSDETKETEDQLLERKEVSVFLLVWSVLQNQR
jgi:ADP-ribosylation factor protein 1